MTQLSLANGVPGADSWGSELGIESLGEELVAVGIAAVGAAGVVVLQVYTRSLRSAMSPQSGDSTDSAYSLNTLQLLLHPPQQ